MDLFSTLAESCGLKASGGIAAQSLCPLLADPGRSIKDAAFTLVVRGPSQCGQSICTDRWRFTQWNDGAQELYDHDTDPEESRVD